MSERVCEECGELTFFNHAQWRITNVGSRHTHGDCEAAARVRERLPIIYGLTIQSLVEIGEALGSFICSTDDEEYADVKALQAVVHRAYSLAMEGIRSEAVDRERVALPVSSAVEGEGDDR